MDPLAEKYPAWSPYAYSLNNPVNSVDPDGKFVVKVVGNGSGSERVVAERYGTVAMGLHTVVEGASGVLSAVNPLYSVIGYASMGIRQLSGDPSVQPDVAEWAVEAGGWAWGGVAASGSRTGSALLRYGGLANSQALGSIGTAKGFAGISEVGLDAHTFLATNLMRVNGTPLTERMMLQWTEMDKAGNILSVKETQPAYIQSITLNPTLTNQWGGAKKSSARLDRLLQAIKFRLRNGLSLNFTHEFEDKTTIDVTIGD